MSSSGDEAQVAGAHRRQQLEADVGGRGAHRHDRLGIFLEVVRREPVGLARRRSGRRSASAAARSAAPAAGCSAGAAAPGAPPGAPSAWAMAGEAIQARISGSTATASCQSGTAVPGPRHRAPGHRRERSRRRAPPRATCRARRARAEPAMARSVCDAVCHSSRWRRVTAHPPERADDRVGRDPRLMGQEDDGQRHLLDAGRPRRAPPRA